MSLQNEVFYFCFLFRSIFYIFRQFLSSLPKSSFTFVFFLPLTPSFFFFHFPPPASSFTSPFPLFSILLPSPFIHLLHLSFPFSSYFSSLLSFSSFLLSFPSSSYSPLTLSCSPFTPPLPFSLSLSYFHFLPSISPFHSSVSLNFSFIFLLHPSPILSLSLINIL